MARSIEERSKLLFEQALVDPNVNATDWDEVEQFVRYEANKLYLDESTVVQIAKERHDALTTEDFKLASELNPEDYDKSLV
jgi:hypothetical protein